MSEPCLRRVFTIALILASSLPLAGQAHGDGPGAADGQGGKNGRPRLGLGQLIERASELDGELVEVEGEAIWPPLRRGEMAWLNIEDDSGAIGVWLPAECLASIERYGSYSDLGDRLRLKAVFHRACPEHGGDLDLHAQSCTVIGRGTRVEHGLPTWKIVASIACCALAGFMALVLARARAPKAAQTDWLGTWKHG